MDLMGYADDMSRIELARRKIGIEADDLSLRRQEYEDKHILDQQRLQMGKLQLGTELMNLMQQQTEIKGFQLYDPANEKSLDYVAQYLAQHGDPKGAMSVMKERNKQKAFDLDVLTKQANVRAKESGQVGNIAGAMLESPEAYKAGYQQLIQEGIDPNKYGLVADPNAGMARAKQLSDATITAAQRTRMRLESQREADRLAIEDKHFRVQEQRLGLMLRNSNVTAARLDLAIAASKRQDAAFQAAQAGKEQRGLNAVTEYTRKMAPELTKTALAEIEADDKLKDLPDAQKQLLSKRVASEVMNKAAKGAKQVSELGNHDWEGEVSSTLQQIMDKELQQPSMIGKLLGKRASIQKSAPPPVAPTQKQMPRISGDADYAKLPKGAQFIAPDGSIRTKP